MSETKKHWSKTVNNLVTNINNNINTVVNITSGVTEVPRAESATYASKATSDVNGKNIIDTYSTKSETVTLTADQTVGGVKTFTSNPVITTRDNAHIAFKSMDAKNGSTSISEEYCGIRILDKDNTDSGSFLHYLMKDSSTSSVVRTTRGAVAGEVGVKINSSGTAFGFAPTTPSTATGTEIVTVDYLNGKNATSSAFGMVKVGSNITVSSGTISLTKSNVTTALGYTPPQQDTVYTLPNATSSVLGGVKIGSNITVSSGTISLTKTNVTDALGYTPPTTNTTYSNMTAATSSAAGKAGLVPAPAAGAQAKFLRGDGTWQTPTNTTYTAASATPLVAGTGAVGTSAKYAREDHVHPAQTTVSGNAGSATKLATARTIDGVDFNGSAAIVHYGTCSTAAATAAKTVALTGFKLVTGSVVYVNFTVTNTAANPTLNVNSTGAKAIYYRNAAITAGYLAANRVYCFVYDGTQYELVGDINTDNNNKTGQTVTTTNAEYPILTTYTAALTSSKTEGTRFASAVTINPSAGSIKATAVYNAVWNDYAEFFERGEETEAGDIIALSLDSDKEVYVKASKETSKAVGVHSDTYGHLIGGKDVPAGVEKGFVEYNLESYIPVGLCGRVKTKVVGTVKKGDFIVISEIPGVGRVYDESIDRSIDVIGIACESSSKQEIKRIKMKLCC